VEKVLKETPELQHLYDLQVEEWVAGYRRRGGTISCRKGCSNCCRLVVNTTFPEVVAIARHLPERFENRLESYVKGLARIAAEADGLKSYLRGVRNRAGGCPFLDPDGSCGIYDWRPLSCRSLLSTDDPKYCAADFANMPQEEKQAFVAGLDRSVVRFPTAYVEITQQLAQQMEGLLLASMLKETGVALSGNLPYMVWLERQHELLLRFSWGKGEVLRYLAANDLGRRYLLDVQKGETKVHLTPRRES